MKKTSCTFWAVLLCLTLPLVLSGCGQGDEGANRQGSVSLIQTESDMVFVPEYLPLPDMEGFPVSGCLSGESLYLLTRETAPARVEIAGVSFLDRATTWRLYRTAPEGGEAVLVDLPLPTIPEDAGGTALLSVEGPGGDGGLWLSSRLTYSRYDFPEGFDPDRDRSADYITETVEETAYFLLDASGRELRRVEGSALAAAIAEDLANCEVSFDPAGRIYVISASAVYVLDEDLRLLCTLSAGEGEYLNTGDAVVLNAGALAVRSLVINDLTGESETRMREIDPAAGTWGRSWTIPDSAGPFYDGGGIFLFFYSSGDGLYGVEAETLSARKLFSWLDVQLEQSSASLVAPLSDGRLAVVAVHWDGGANPMVLALLREIPKSEVVLPEKTVLTFATAWQLDSMTEARIKDFNAASTDCVIEVRNYFEEAGGDYDASRLLFQTELTAGHIPDILYLSGLDLTALEDQGYLEDLWPWIDADPDIEREDLMIKPLEAVQRRGQLHMLFDRFSIITAAGAPSRVGTGTGWTLAELQEIWDAQPENTLLFGPWDTKTSVLNQLFSLYCDSLVDWEAGVCSFDSEAFRELLAFCASFPDEEVIPARLGLSNDVIERLYTGQQLLTDCFIGSPYNIQQDRAILGGEANYIGYPTPDGGCGSYFSSGGGSLAMLSAGEHKEEAWSFLRQLLLPQLGEGKYYYSLTYLPINKQDFDFMVQYDMMSNPGVSTVYEFMTIEEHAVTQDEVDQLMALYESIDTNPREVAPLSDLVSAHAGAYFSGDKSLDETVRLIQSAATLYVNERR